MNIKSTSFERERIPKASDLQKNKIPRVGIRDSNLETEGISVYIASIEISTLEVKIPDLLLR